MRQGVYIFWVGIALLCFPLYMYSAKELAPTEDQGVIFGIVDAQSNSTMDQSSHYAKIVNNAFMGFPETDFTFQVTFPTGGFAGMVLKPWEDRDRTVFEIKPDVQKKLSEISGVRILPITPPALPGGGQFPGPELVVTSGGFEEDGGLGWEEFEEFLQVAGRGGEGAGGNDGGLGGEQAGAGGA